MRATATGFLPSGADERDFAFSAPEPVDAPRVLPVPFVRDQGDVPCCVSIAVATCMEILDAREGAVRRLAPLFNYYVTRSGAAALEFVEPREALKQATRYGIASAAAHPDPARCTDVDARREPSDEAYEDARQQRILLTPNLMRTIWYERLGDSDRVEAWRAALEGGLPVLIGFSPAAGYWTETARTGRLTGRGIGGSDGHAAVVVGTFRSTFVVQDSRGRSFGRDGQWLLPFALAEEVVEAWVIRKVTYD